MGKCSQEDNHSGTSEGYLLTFLVDVKQHRNRGQWTCIGLICRIVERICCTTIQLVFHSMPQ